MKFELPIFQIWSQGLLLGLKMAWPVLLIVGSFFLVKWILIQREKRELAKSGIDQIDKMSGKAFEKYLEVLFENLGYRVERTRYVGDYGADLVTRKDGIGTVIQVKRNRGKVGIKAVQEAVASKGYYGCERAMAVTNSYFTAQAKRLAASNGVDLWDRRDLAKAMNSMALAPDSTRTRPAFQPIVNEINAAIPAANGSTCATCGKPVSEKVRDYCLSHAERFGGKIYCYDHQKKIR